MQLMGVLLEGSRVAFVVGSGTSSTRRRNDNHIHNRRWTCGGGLWHHQLCPLPSTCQQHRQDRARSREEQVMEYTPEPWKQGTTRIGVRFHVMEPNYGCIADMNGLPEQSEANARRIVACVNACSGVPTEVLEGVTSEISLILTHPHFGTAYPLLETPHE